MSSKDRLSSNLVALGTAAVITVYAAGYARTQPAAQQLADEEAAERRPAQRAAAPNPVSDSPVPPPVSPAVQRRPPAPAREAVRSRDTIAPGPPATALRIDTAPPPTAPPIVPPASAPIPAPPQAAPPVRDTARAAPVTPPPDSTAKPASAEVDHYKDGIFFGWGTSRHGDIQMGIEIKDGRIKSAFISECNTQYSCSWINHLPKQVVDRQSADVDYVSGATQSATALYRAVVNALKQAK